MDVISSAVDIKEISLKHNLEEKTKAEGTEVSCEEHKKKIKLSGDKMDPLKFFSRSLVIPKMIFHHFNGTDLLAISEVNQSYYNFIALSKGLMENITVVFDEKRKLKTSEDFNLLSNSSRLYQNIKILGPKSYYDYSITTLALDFLQSQTHEWRNISLRNVYFEHKRNLWKFLSSIEKSVECIFITEYHFNPFKFLYKDLANFKSFKPLKFSKLKKLRLDLNNDSDLTECYVKFFSNSVAVKELNLGYYLSIDKVTKMLNNFDKLTSLTVTSSHIDQMFHNKYQFKLKSLTVSTRVSRRYELSNLRKFLYSQRYNLEELVIKLHYDRETFAVIMKLPKLKSLCLEEFHDLPKNEIPTEFSNSITELNVDSNVDAVSIKFLLKSMPNVGIISLCTIDEDIVEMLEKKFENLFSINL